MTGPASPSPGAVGSPTAVAIDVFPDPAVPTPTGFQGPGTHFVNISLTLELTTCSRQA